MTSFIVCDWQASGLAFEAYSYVTCPLKETGSWHLSYSDRFALEILRERQHANSRHVFCELLNN